MNEAHLKGRISMGKKRRQRQKSISHFLFGLSDHGVEWSGESLSTDEQSLCVAVVCDSLEVKRIFKIFYVCI